MRRALVCEDDSAIRALVTTLLKREGFAVDAAEDGQSGIEMMKDDCYDVLVLDLMMPRKDGFAVVDELRDRCPSNLKRVIIMTAATEAIRGELRVPVCTILPKPFDIGKLADAVRQCASECGTPSRTAVR